MEGRFSCIQMEPPFDSSTRLKVRRGRGGIVQIVILLGVRRMHVNSTNANGMCNQLILFSVYSKLFGLEILLEKIRISFWVDMEEFFQGDGLDLKQWV